MTSGTGLDTSCKGVGADLSVCPACGLLVSAAATKPCCCRTNSHTRCASPGAWPCPVRPGPQPWASARGAAGHPHVDGNHAELNFFFFEFYLKKNSIPASHLDTFISLCLSRSQIHGNLFLSSYFVILFAPLFHAAPSSPLLPALALTFYESPCVFPLPWS